MLTEKRTDAFFKTHPHTVSSAPGKGTSPTIQSLLSLVQDVKEFIDAPRDDAGQLYSDRPQASVMYSKMRQDDQPLYSERNYDAAVIAAPVVIDNERFYEVVVVEFNEKRNSYYVHEVVLENGTAPMFKSGEMKYFISGDRSYPSLKTIMQSLVDVNKNNDTDNQLFHIEKTEVRGPNRPRPLLKTTTPSTLPSTLR